MSKHSILAINPGSTSTKIALYEDTNEILREDIKHSIAELKRYDCISDQYDLRKEAVLSFFENSGYNLHNLSAIVGRGGLLPPVNSGAYLVNEKMVDRLLNRPVVQHASNLGAVIAYDLAVPLGIPAYIYDSVAVDELAPVAKLSGLPEITRKSHVHALNMRAVSVKVASQMERFYYDCNFIVAHLGGGITISAQQKGKMVDIVSDDEGPFSPERAGRVPCKQIIGLCFSGKYSLNDMLRKFGGDGGLAAYLGTVNAIEVEGRIKKCDAKAQEVYYAMSYQIAKGIGEMATVLEGKVDKIILTGGLAYSSLLTQWIKNRVEFIAPVEIVPGENELESLALGALRVLKGEEKAYEYNLE